MGMISYWSKWLFGGGNYGLLGRSLTSYHESLRKFHQSSFPNYLTLVSVAGLLDASAYISRGEIEVGEIMSLAHNIIDKYNINDFDFSSDEKLRVELICHFVMGMQLLEFCVDNPSLSSEEVGKTITTNAIKTYKSVNDVFYNYKKNNTDKEYDQAVNIWMNSPNTLEIRKLLNIL